MSYFGFYTIFNFPECVFCRIVAGTEPARMVAVWPEAVAFHPLEPVTPGHVLVVPTTHVSDFMENANVSADAMRFAAVVANSLNPRRAWNLITSKGHEATQSVYHLHLHLVPRTTNDGLALPWYSGRSKTEATQ